MKTILAILFLTLACNAQRAKWPPVSDWYTVWHKGYPYTWSFQNEPDGVVQVPFPASYAIDYQNKDLWLNQILTRSVQGNIVGKTISITFTVTVPPDGSGRWLYNGYLAPDIYGTRNVSVGLFLIGYDALYAQVSPRLANLSELTQWGSTRIYLPEAPGDHTITITAAVDQANFTNVNGARTGIGICASDVKQIGLSLAGGKWYSVGIGAPSPAGATITINSLTVQ